MRDYQRFKNNKYYLPKAVYHQTLWFIRDYQRMKERLDEMLVESSSADGMPRGSATGDPTMARVMKRENLLKKTLVIENAMAKIPEEYRKGVWNSVMYNKAYPLDADRTTYARYKSKFISQVALEMGFVHEKDL